MTSFLRTWLRLALLLGGVLLVVAGFVTAVNWASAELFSEPWDALASGAVTVLVATLVVAFFMTRDKRS